MSATQANHLNFLHLIALLVQKAGIVTLLSTYHQLYHSASRSHPSDAVECKLSSPHITTSNKSTTVLLSPQTLTADYIENAKLLIIC